MIAMSEGLRVTLRQATPIPLAAAFRCAPGELLALVGPSGSGKTTILRTIAGLVGSQEGAISLDGTVWFDAATGVNTSVQDRRCGFVFQDYALFPHMTACENVAVALSHVSITHRRQQAEAQLARVNLEGLEDRLPHALSGGQRQRVAVARALARDPSVLLLDEPFAAVDQVTRRRLQEELVRLRRTLDIPTILVTHDLAEARMLADKLCVIHEGKTLQSGPPEDVLHRPTSSAVARLVDISNVFYAAVHHHDEAKSATFLDWKGVSIEGPYRPDLKVGSAVEWVVPSAFVVLHRRDRPSRGEHENPVDGTVHDLTALGDTVRVSIRPANEPKYTVVFSVPTHVARRNGLEVGVSATLSLLAEGVHVMAEAD